MTPILTRLYDFAQSTKFRLQFQGEQTPQRRILHKVNKTLGNDDILKEFEKNMVNAEKTIALLQKELDALKQNHESPK